MPDTKALHRIGLMPKRFIRPRDANDPSWGNPLTNAISFGLLLGALGLVAAIVYVFFRMGAK